jgi:hypothetical protein
MLILQIAAGVFLGLFGFSIFVTFAAPWALDKLLQQADLAITEHEAHAHQ